MLVFQTLNPGDPDACWFPQEIHSRFQKKSEFVSNQELIRNLNVSQRLRRDQSIREMLIRSG